MSQFDRAYMISRALKMQDKTLQDRTMADKLAWPDFAGQDNDGQEKHHAWVEIKTYSGQFEQSQRLQLSASLKRKAEEDDAPLRQI